MTDFRFGDVVRPNAWRHFHESVYTEHVRLMVVCGKDRGRLNVIVLCGGDGPAWPRTTEGELGSATMDRMELVED